MTNGKCDDARIKFDPSSDVGEDLNVVQREQCRTAGDEKEVMQLYGGHIIGQREESRYEDNSAKCVILEMKFLLYAAMRSEGHVGEVR